MWLRQREMAGDRSVSGGGRAGPGNPSVEPDTTSKGRPCVRGGGGGGHFSYIESRETFELTSGW